jgi:hypothetical protein
MCSALCRIVTVRPLQQEAKMNELIRRLQNGEVAKQDKAAAKQIKDTYDEVRLRGLQVDGALALGAHIMEGVQSLDSQRKSLAGSDMAMAILLADIEANTIRQVKNIQNSLFNEWGF